MLERRPIGFVLGFRFLYGLRIVSPLAIGASALPLRRFVALNVCAAIIWGISFTALGYLFGSAIERVAGDMRSVGPVLIGAAILAACLIGATLVVRRLAQPPAS